MLFVTDGCTLYNEQLVKKRTYKYLFVLKKLRKCILQGLESNRKVEILKLLLFAPETNIIYV